MSVVDIVNAYFDAIRAHDATAVGELFTADGELVTAAGTYRGPDAIAAFYRDIAFTQADLMPEPGPLLVDDERVAVEIRLRMGGSTTRVGDFFDVSAEGIRRLAIYLGPPVE